MLPSARPSLPSHHLVSARLSSSSSLPLHFSSHDRLPWKLHPFICAVYLCAVTVPLNTRTASAGRPGQASHESRQEPPSPGRRGRRSPGYPYNYPPSSHTLPPVPFGRLCRLTPSTMPALPTYFDAITSKLDSLVVRDPEIPPVVAREPAPDIAAGGAIAPNALNERATLALAKRQVQQGVIPSYYDDSGPDAGMVVGIVLGSVAGFLLIVWLLYSLTTLGGNAAAAGEEEIVVRRRRGSDSRRSRRSTHTEMRDYSRSPRRRDHIIVEERRAPRTRSIIVEERARVPGDDVVEVIEEHDEYRERRGGRRSGSRYRY